jgi:hypothetical protein
MNEQQMREKYKGIMQFQMVLLHEELNKVIFDLCSFLQLDLDEEDYQQTRTKVIDENRNDYYYVKSKSDSRNMVLIDFNGRYTCVLVIRFSEEQEGEVRDILTGVELENELTNTIINQSRINQIATIYQLDIDRVDEYDIWNTVLKRKKFWDEYARFTVYELEDENNIFIHPELAEDIHLPVTDDTYFSISTGDQIVISSLCLAHPSLDKPIELGWDDMAQWHPNVFRWEEFEQICLFFTIQYPDNFVIPFLLLLRFTPITEEDNEKQIARKIKAAFRYLNLFTEEEIETFHSIVSYKTHFKWALDAETQRFHACGSPDDVYSMRHICTNDFPFTELSDVLATIRTHQKTDEWKNAKEKWNQLIKQYSNDDDENWFTRTEE